MYAKLVDSGWINFYSYSYRYSESRREYDITSFSGVLQTQSLQVQFDELQSEEPISQLDFDYIKLSCVQAPSFSVILNKGGFCMLMPANAIHSSSSSKYEAFPMIELQLYQNGKLQIQSLKNYIDFQVSSNSFSFQDKNTYNIELYKYV